MTIEPTALTAPKAPSLASQLAKMRETAARDLAARQNGTPPASIRQAPLSDEAASVKDGAEQAETARRQAAKDQARQRIQTIMEKLKIIKKMASENPETMARMLAPLVKELKKAIDAYVAAGGTAGGWSTSLANSSGAPAPDSSQQEKPSDTYRQMRDSLAGSEAASDMEFVKNAKGIAKSIRELLDKAKIQIALREPDDETKKAFEETEGTLGEIDKTLDDLARGIAASSPAAGLFVALYA